MSKNQFAPAMAQFVVPSHMSRSISIEGFDLAADDNGVLEAPERFAPTLLAHGLMRMPAAVAAPQGNKQQQAGR